MNRLSRCLVVLGLAALYPASISVATASARSAAPAHQRALAARTMMHALRAPAPLQHLAPNAFRGRPALPARFLRMHSATEQLHRTSLFSGAPAKAALPIAAGWKGSQAPRPGFAPDPQAFMEDLSCISAGNCWAAGNYAAPDGLAPSVFYHLSGGKWTDTTAPVPTGAVIKGPVEIYNLTCTKHGRCVAVGDYYDRLASDSSDGDSQALIETEQNGVWKAITAPLPGNADKHPQAALFSVSCPKISACVAVGTYGSHGNQVPMIEERSGSGWKVFEAPLPNGALAGNDSFLDSIACTSPGVCTAAGDYAGPSNLGGLIVQDNHGVWTATGVTVNGDLNFDAVACPAASHCLTVGEEYKNSGATVPFAAVQSGTKWTQVVLPLPTGVKPNNFTDMLFAGLSCSSAHQCVAAGNYLNNNGNPFPLIVLDTSGIWTDPAVTAPNGAALKTGYLSAVSCVDQCLAVGEYQSQTTPHALLVKVSGGHISVLHQPTPPGNRGPTTLDAVSCVAHFSCVAGGSYTDASDNLQLWFAQNNGSTWSASDAALPKGAGAPQDLWLVKVACPKTGACYALGTNQQRSVYAEVLHKGKWSAHSIPMPANAGWNAQFNITGLACPAVGTCVGTAIYINVGNTVKSEIISLSKGKWTATTSPLPSGVAKTASIDLSSVACRSATACVAAGAYVSQKRELTMLVSGSGTSWKATTAPLPAKSQSAIAGFLQAIACSATACLAVGDFEDSGKNLDPLLISGSGTHWTASQPPIPAGGVGNFRQFSALFGVDCGAGGCAATGLYIDAYSNQLGFLLGQVHGKWVATQAPLPGRSAGGGVIFNAISCQASNGCAAVGSYQDANFSLRSLIVTGSGKTWKNAVPTWPVKHAPQSILYAVACPAAGACVASGNHEGPNGSALPLTVTQSGSKWNAAGGALPADASTSGNQDAGTVSIACPSKTTCVAAGQYVDSHLVLQGLIETKG